MSTIPPETTISEMSDEIVKRCKSSGQACVVAWSQIDDDEYHTDWHGNAGALGFCEHISLLIKNRWRYFHNVVLREEEESDE